VGVPLAVEVPADDVAGCVNGVRVSSLNCGGVIERLVGAVLEQEAVDATGLVGVAADDRPSVVDAVCVGVGRARDAVFGKRGLAATRPTMVQQRIKELQTVKRARVEHY